MTFSANLFKANQFCNFFSSVEINLQVSSKLFPVQNMLVSSANIMKFNNLEILHMSLIYKINNFGELNFYMKSKRTNRAGTQL